jgi:hypothetical protein
MFGNLIGKIIFIVLVGATVLAMGATAMKVGAESFSDPVGVSIRSESARGPHGYGFFIWHSRTYRGGGPAYGK